MRISELGHVGQQRPRPPEQWNDLYRCRDLRRRYDTRRPTADYGQRYLQRLYGWLRARGGNAAPYLASGSYQNAWNFQTRTGAFNGSFDGRSYSGTTQATGGAGSTTFGGNFSGGSRSGSLNGAFFASPSDAAKYQAGTFSIGNNGSGYRASGIFAGQR